MKKLLLILVVLFGTISLKAQKIELIKSYTYQKVKQAVAVDDDNFYVINNTTITKYEKDNGIQTGFWEDSLHVLRHLNSGIIRGGKLYCTHSNYPDCPMASSIEIFDPQTMKHIGSHSFGIQYGSATWVDFHDDSWWVCFANYSLKGSCEGRDNHWTQLVRFDRSWRQVGAWIFPDDLIEKFSPKSNSGGAWGPHNKLYLTGHDSKELYVVSIPDRGFTLVFEKAIPMIAEGQGFSFDHSVSDKTILYGIVRRLNEVVVMQVLN